MIGQRSKQVHQANLAPPRRSTPRSTPRSTAQSTQSLGGRLPSRPGAGREIFPPSLFGLNSNFEIFFRFLIFHETSRGHISVIRTPIYKISDSFPTKIPRRTQRRNPFPLVLILKFNSAQIYGYNTLLKYGLLHSPLLKGFRPRNL